MAIVGLRFNRRKGEQRCSPFRAAMAIVGLVLLVGYSASCNAGAMFLPLSLNNQNDGVAISSLGITETSEFSRNEELYDAAYWKYQAKMNEFGAAYKGDIIHHIISAQETKPQNILEFGSSGGYILASMPVQNRYGVEINPASRAFAYQTFKDAIAQVFTRVEEIPKDLVFDVIYTTSVLEHVDCPLCELRKLKHKLDPDHGILIVGLKNDGADLGQTFTKVDNDPNHHIYTWNQLLLANLIKAAGYNPCQVIGQFDAWHAIDTSVYKNDKYGYCRKGLETGKRLSVYNLWAVSMISGDAECLHYQTRAKEILNCAYLKGS
jgi:SAM-dependent methyltransferase